MSDAVKTTDRNALAIIAVAGRFPGARNVEEFWANLRSGTESVHFFTDDELRAAGVSEAQLVDPNYVKARPRLDDVAQFDATFFGIPPREAEVMDPQQRLFLETAHEALERAGVAPDQFDGLIGVFAAAPTSSYLLHNLNGHPRASEAAAALGIGNFPDFLATRVSYKLNLRGPAFTLQTACSGSLVAVHVAAQSLLNFECDAAVAGGATVILPQETGYGYAEEGVTSPDGHCRPFDAAARGTIFGSGVGAVVLRRLADALRDGDRILAVLKGSAINNDGAAKAGFTAPAVSGQAEVIGEALANAGVSADDISYVEAHGTATPLGDPIEVAALTQAFRETTQRRGFCALGSVKSNIGHLDAAGGVTGLIKTVLALHHGELPASMHFKTPNPKIDFASSPFVVNATLKPWPKTADGAPRRAGVSAFGVGGTNAHVILEEAPRVMAVVKDAAVPVRPWELLVLSARTETALAEATKKLATRLAGTQTPTLAETAQTLREGRRHFEHRRAIVAATLPEAVTALTAVDAGRVATGVVKTGTREVAFLFPGQGAQAVNMGKELHAAEPVYRAAFDRCAALFRPLIGEDLHAAVYPTVADDAAEARLRRTELAQPALFAVEYALAQVWLAWGVKPAALLGHSLGELTAACVAGVFSLDDAVRLVAARGRLMKALPEGAMLAVTLAPAQVKTHLNTALSLAIVNGPTACVVAGATEEIARLEDTLRSAGVMARRLPTSHAFQSHLMEPVMAPFLAEVRAVKLHAPKIPVISNVTGRWLTATEATDPAYWARQLRQTVYFADGLRELAKEPNRLLVEVGPGRILAGLARSNLDTADTRSVWPSLPDTRERKPEGATLLGTLGRLWIAGVSIDWKSLRAPGLTRRVELPTYPFERRRHWIDPMRGAAGGGGGEASAPVRAPLDEWFYVPTWKQSVARPVAATAEIESAAWIVTLDKAGVGAALAARWRVAGRVVTEREPGADWEEGLRAARAGGRRIAGIAATDFMDAANEGEASEAFHRLIALAPALVATETTEPLRLLLPTVGVHRVLGTDRVRPAGALAAGLAQVLPIELPWVDARQVDLGGADTAERASEILAEEFLIGDRARLAAWRAGGRWLPHFEAVASPALEATATAGLRERGVYVITGGFGGIGLALAETLARTAKARLVLVSRRGGAGQSEATARLEALGGEVLALAADIGTTAAWTSVLAAAEARWGAVHGVIHAAGVPGRTIAMRKTRAETQAVFAPKIDGAAALVEASAGRSFDFVLFCSSLAVWSGSAGQSDYVAANAWLDAQAAALTARGVPVISVNWDLWSGAGMGLAEAKGNPFAITPAEGGEVLRRLLAAPRTQVIVSTGRLPGRFSAVGAAATAMIEAAARHPRPALTTEFAEPAVGAERQLAEQWATLLGLEKVGADDNFFELGGDSLSAMQALSAIKSGLGVTLAVTLFYDAPTPRRLAPAVVSAQSSRL